MPLVRSCVQQRLQTESVRSKTSGRRPIERKRAGLTNHFLQVPLQGFVLGLASMIFHQQLLEDVGPKLIDTLKGQRKDLNINRNQYRASCHHSYPKTRGLVGGGIGSKTAGSNPRPAKEFKIEKLAYDLR
jgi:hypothetical protein